MYEHSEINHIQLMKVYRHVLCFPQESYVNSAPCDLSITHAVIPLRVCMIVLCTMITYCIVGTYTKFWLQKWCTFCVVYQDLLVVTVLFTKICFKNRVYLCCALLAVSRDTMLLVSSIKICLRSYGIAVMSTKICCTSTLFLEANSHITRRSHAAPMPFPCHAVPLRV
jgi:hypothetical protein